MTVRSQVQSISVVQELIGQSFDPNVPPPSSMQQVHDFMGQTTKWLDETEYIALVFHSIDTRGQTC